ncbi:MAG: methylisocitrate lyase [Candidatus Velamenicoccus archaeovorus]
MRGMLEGDGTIVVPGVFDGLTALLATRAGARALYLSGAAFSASMGLPDVGLIAREEVVGAMRRIARVTRVPTIVDADTGFGGPLHVMRTVRELEGAGAAAIQIEDQVDPKRCGHLEGKQVVEPGRMVEKVAAAVAARRDLLVVARTDARATHDLDEAIRRGLAYHEAGADVVFPEALETEDEFAAYAAAVPGPLLANMTEFGKGPLLTAARLAELGYRLVIFPVSAARVAARAVEAFYADLLAAGAQDEWLDRMMTRDQLYELIGYDAYAELDRALARDPGEPRED